MQQQFLDDLQKIYDYFEAQKKECNLLFSYLETNQTDKLSIIDEFAKTFGDFKTAEELKEKIKEVKLYATALGIYSLKLNGKRVEKEYFSPGFTNYKKLLQYSLLLPYFVSLSTSTTDRIKNTR